MLERNQTIRKADGTAIRADDYEQIKTSSSFPAFGTVDKPSNTK